MILIQYILLTLKQQKYIIFLTSYGNINFNFHKKNIYNI